MHKRKKDPSYGPGFGRCAEALARCNGIGTLKRVVLGAVPLMLLACASGQQQPAPKYAAVVPPSIQTPDMVQSRIGTLKFIDGLPNPETVEKVYDNLDFSRGVETFLAGIPATSVHALCEGFGQAGYKANHGIGITENLSDARSLFLTSNSTVVYAWFCVDLKDGPMVVQTPPGVLGIVDDAYFRHVTDVGVTGPDQGKGGKYLMVPPGYQGTLPDESYIVRRTRTNTNLFILRAFVQAGDVAATVRNVKASARVYALSAAANPPEQKFVNISGLQFNTVHSNDFRFYEELNAVMRFPRQTGHPFHGKLDTDSTAIWTASPAQTGH
ncbi:DUF1254 domain-containing protein [Cupriavidus necator]